MPDRVRPQSIRSRCLIVSLVSIAGVAVSTLIYGTLIWREQFLVESQFQLDTKDVASVIEGSFAAHLEVVGALTAFDRASEKVSRDEFHIFTSYYLPSRPGIRELAWLPQVLDVDRVRHTKETAREPGFADYQIRDLDTEGDVVTPAATREVYFPVQYLEPAESTHRSGLTLGLDLTTHPPCRTAMQQAGDTGQMVAIRQIAPGGQNRGLSGYFAFVPIYNKELSEQRGTQKHRGSLKGFVVGVCSIEAIVEAALKKSWPPGISVRLLDYPPDAGAGQLLGHGTTRQTHPLSGASQPSSAPVLGGLQHAVSLEIPDSNWTVVCTPTAGYRPKEATNLPLAALLTGFVVTAVLTMYANTLMGRTAEVKRLVVERTAEIAERERAEKALRVSEARYRTLFESTGDAIMLLDRKGFFECNEATLRFFACGSHAEFLAKHPADLSPPTQPDGTDSRSAADAKIAAAFDQGLLRFEWLHRRLDGTDVMADVLLARLDLGPRRVLQAVVRDITERKRAEQILRDAHAELERRVAERTAELATANEELQREVADRKRAEENLRETEAVYQSLVDSLPLNVFRKDLDGRILFGNQRYCDTLGKPLDALVGKTDADLMPAELAAKYRQDDATVVETGAVLENVEEHRKPDGESTYIQVLKAPVRDAWGKTVGVQGMFWDVTEQKRAAESLRVAKEAAEAANRAKSDFLANISHEIRTPMNAIIGMTELVLDTELDDSQREFLEMVQGSGESLMMLINQILDLSKIEAGKLELDRSVFHPHDSLSDTVKLLAVRAHDKGLELACQIHPDVPETVLGDAARLRQIVVNLVGNAIKFTDDGEVVLDVYCESRSDDAVVLHFAVTDTGMGIPPDKHKVIFGAFEQADPSTTRRFGGTGLGLAISSKLVELMHGQIWVESKVGRGSTFHFTARFELAAVDKVAGPDLGAIQGTRVLVVDDNATNRRILRETLDNWRLRPSVAAGVPEALELLRAAQQAGDPYVLVLADANMPETDGFSLTGRIKQDGELDGAVIMMLTSGNRPGDVARCQQLGVAAYLLKPVRQSELFESIAKALGIPVAADKPIETRAADRGGRRGPLRVLLAEDSLVNQKLAVALLERKGHLVTVAGNGQEAVTAAQSQAFDLILMDVQMPEMDGLEATAMIRAAEARTGGRVPIIAMTAHALRGDRVRCIEAGMDEYIAKPIRPKEFFDTINTVLGTAAAADTPTRQLPAGGDVLEWSAALRTVRGDHELLADMIRAFLTEAPALINTIRDAMARSEAGPLRVAAHSLKGSMGYFGANRAQQQACRLEEMARQDNLEDSPAALADLEAEMARLTPILQDYLDQRGPAGKAGPRS